jgi:3-oxoacyl-[acyl-carrier-protein] synthase III
MSTPVITALAAYVPPAIPLARWYEIEAKLQATALTGWPALVYPPWFAAYGLDPGQITERPGDTGVSSADCATGVDLVPVEAQRDLSGLAADAAQAICGAREPCSPPVGVVMFCHSSLNEHVSTTTAGRLRAVIGSPCFPFAVSQQQGASVFTALRLASDLFAAEPDLHAILIVAAEKWCHPFSRRAGRWALQGDAACALLVERASPATRGLRLLAAATRTLHQIEVPFALSLPPSGTDTAFTPALLDLIDTLLLQHRIRADQIAAVIGHNINLPPGDAVSRHPGLSQTHPMVDGRAYLGAAESIVRLTEALDAPELPHGSLILAWGIGLGGYVGCTLLEAQGTPQLCALNDAPRPS